MGVPFLDLRGQHTEIREELDAAIAGVLDSGQYVLGPAVADFEEAFANYCDAGHAVAVNSGTSALHLALLAADVGPGDEVITVSMTFVATVAAIVYTGATPVMVDVDPDTWTMDPTQIEAAITPQTKAIMPVHLHGLMADMKAIQVIADAYGLRVIEDAAQAHGAERAGQRAGSAGSIAGFSFYPGKNLGALGEGGAVVTSDLELADRVRLLRDWGTSRKYHHDVLGFNYRMDGIQGALLRVKLRYLERWTEERRLVAAAYESALAPTRTARPVEPVDARHVYHVYAVRSADRLAAQEAFDAADVGHGIHYPVPVHLQPAFAAYGDGRGSLPVSEEIADELLSLPIFPGMTVDQSRRVIGCLTGSIGLP